MESIHVSLVVSVQGEKSEVGLGWIMGWGPVGSRASTVALQQRGCHDDGEQEGDGTCVQRDACSGGLGGVGRTAVDVCGHGGGVGVGGGVSPCCGVCAVLGHHLC